MSDEKPEQRDDILPPDEIARRLSVLADAIAGLRAQQRDMDHYAEISTELARLWNAVVETKTMLVEIQRERRDETARKNELVDWSKTKVH
jgi:hypothetical protein